MIFVFNISAEDPISLEVKEITSINICAPDLKSALKQFPNYHKFIEEAK